MKLLRPLLPALCALVLLAPPALAQADAAPPSTAEITSRIAGAQALDEALRKRTVDAYQASLELIRHAEEQRVRTEELQRLASEAPKATAEARQRLASEVTEPKIKLPEDGTLATYEERLRTARGAVTKAQEALEEYTREGERRAERRRTLPGTLATLRGKLPALASAVTAEVGTEPLRAEGVLARAQLLQARAELALGEAQLAHDEARQELFALERDLAKGRKQRAEALASQWQAAVDVRRRQEVEESATRRRKLLAEAVLVAPEIHPLVDETRKLTDQRSGVSRRLERASSLLREAQERPRRLREHLDRLRRRVGLGTPSESAGLLLRRAREALPRRGDLQAQREENEAALVKVQAELIELEDKRDAAEVETLLRKLTDASDRTGESLAVFTETVRGVLEERRGLLDTLIGETQRLLDRRYALSQSHDEEALATREFEAFVSARIFWVRSVSGPLIPTWDSLRSATSWLLTYDSFVEDAKAGKIGTRDALIWLGVALLALILGLRLLAGGDPARLFDVLRSAALGALVGAPLLFFSWGYDASTPHGLAVSDAALALALYAGVWVALLHFLRRGGVAEKGLQWGPEVARTLRVLAQGLAVPYLLAITLVAAFETPPDPAWTGSVGRVAFVVAMLLQSVGLAWALSHAGPVRSALLKRINATLLRVSVVFLSVFPLVMAVLALLGYYYTALRLQVRYEASLVALFGALLLRALLLRLMTPAALRELENDLAQSSAVAVSVPGAAPAEPGQAGEVQPSGAASSEGAPSQPSSSDAQASVAQGTEASPESSQPTSATASADPSEVPGETKAPAAELGRGAPTTESSAAREDAPPPSAAPAGGGSAIGAERQAGDPEAPAAATAAELAAAALVAESGSAAPDSASFTRDPESEGHEPSREVLSSGELRIYQDAEADEEAQASLPVTAEALAALLRPATSSAGPSAAQTEQLTLLRDLAEQARQTVRVVVAIFLLVSLGLIWAEMVPALGRLRSVQLYPSLTYIAAPKDKVPSVAPPPGAAAAGSTPSTPLPTLSAAAKPTADKEPAPPEQLTITLADLGLAILILLSTALVVRSLPGALQFALLGRLPLDAGARYAASTVTRYGLIFFGLWAATTAIGIGWERVQWLAAALTFGLAFGMQEIFANLVSGLIILFERPVRVGDVVTVGDITGRVTRVRIRATTITDWNRKELILPNKELVTGRVINWTLTESTVRSLVPIGIAYGSDIALAQELILAAARAQPEVMTDPAPACYFEGFADSFYDLQLRIFLPSPGVTLKARDGILKRVAASFAAAQIEIAFPQRDLHLRSADALLKVETSTPKPPPRSRGGRG